MKVLHIIALIGVIAVTALAKYDDDLADADVDVESEEYVPSREPEELQPTDAPSALPNNELVIVIDFLSLLKSSLNKFFKNATVGSRATIGNLDLKYDLTDPRDVAYVKTLQKIFNNVVAKMNGHIVVQKSKKGVDIIEPDGTPVSISELIQLAHNPNVEAPKLKRRFWTEVYQGFKDGMGLANTWHSGGGK